MQLSNQKIKPDMRLTVVQVVHTSLRAVLVKCLVLGDNRETSVMFARPDDNLRLAEGREVHVWQPWTVIDDTLLCTRFVVVT